MVSQSAGAVAARSGGGDRSAPPPGARGARPGGRSSRGRGSVSYQGVDDTSPGFAIQPVYVVVMSITFIFFVAILHVIAKLRG